MVERTIAAIAVIALLLAGNSVSRGADLSISPQYAPATVAPVPYSWTGIYLGLNGAYGYGQFTPMSLFSSDYSAFNFDANGWLGGFTAGAQIQAGHTVMGLEADVDWANIAGSSKGNVFFNGAPIGTATLSSTISSVSTARARVGYALDNWLIFGTGGLAVTNQVSNLTGPVGFLCGTGAFNSPPCSSLSQLHLGLSAGAGLEYGISQNLSAKGEWIWIGAGAGNTLKENLLRAGLNWRFGM
jgi:outer membrane immunogenic protein